MKTIARRGIIASGMPGSAGRVRSEVEAMTRVRGHANVVELRSAHEDERGVHIAMVSKREKRKRRERERKKREKLGEEKLTLFFSLSLKKTQKN